MRALIPILVLALLAGCGDKIQEAEPPARGPASASPHGDLPPGHPPMGEKRIDPHGTKDGTTPADPFADPADAGKPATDAPAGGDPSRVLFAGEVVLDPPDAKLPARYTVYISAGQPPRVSPPVLSKRYDKPTFPFAFELKEGDLAFAGTQTDQPLGLSVIITESGDVLRKEGLHVKVVAPGPYPPGTTGIKITLKL